MKKTFLLLATVCAVLIDSMTMTSIAETSTSQSPATSLTTSNGSTKSNQAPRPFARPSSPSDLRGWFAYFCVITQENSEGLTGPDSYLYFIPSGNDSNAKNARQRQSAELNGIAVRRILPGNFLAFAGPDSSIVTDSLVEAFKRVTPGWAKGSTLLFIGSPSDRARAFDALRTSGATLRFANMQSTPFITPTRTDLPLPRFILPPPAPPPLPPPPTSPPRH